MTTDNAQANQNAANDANANANANASVTIAQTELDALRSQIDTLRADNAHVTEQYKAVVLRLLPEDARKNAEAILADIDKDADLSDKEVQLQALAKDIRARELAIEYKDYGVTAEKLMSAETNSAMELMAAQAKVAFLEGKLGGNSNLANLPSDKGGTSSAQGQLPAINGKGISAVAAHLGEVARAKHGTS